MKKNAVLSFLMLCLVGQVGAQTAQYRLRQAIEADIVEVVVEEGVRAELVPDDSNWVQLYVASPDLIDAAHPVCIVEGRRLRVVRNANLPDTTTVTVYTRAPLRLAAEKEPVPLHFAAEQLPPPEHKVTLGFEPGLGAITSYTSQNDYDSPYLCDKATTVSVVMPVHIRYSDRWGIGTGIGYRWTNIKYLYPMDYLGNGRFGMGANQTSQLQLHTITMPLRLEYKVNSNTHIDVGLNAGVNVVRRFKTKTLPLLATNGMIHNQNVLADYANWFKLELVLGERIYNVGVDFYIDLVPMYGSKIHEFGIVFYL